MIKSEANTRKITQKETHKNRANVEMRRTTTATTTNKRFGNIEMKEHIRENC